MTKSELRQMLEMKVEEKVGQGFEIPTYAMDVAATDRLKHGLKAHSRPMDYDDQKEREWMEFLRQVEIGIYKPESNPLAHAPAKPQEKDLLSMASSGSVGLWKVRRH